MDRPCRYFVLFRSLLFGWEKFPAALMPWWFRPLAPIRFCSTTTPCLVWAQFLTGTTNSWLSSKIIPYFLPYIVYYRPTAAHHRLHLPLRLSLERQRNIPSACADATISVLDMKLSSECTRKQNRSVTPPLWLNLVCWLLAKFRPASFRLTSNVLSLHVRCSAWKAADGSVYLQVANPSSEHIASHADLILGNLSPVTVVEPETLRVHAVAATPTTVGELAAARCELTELSKALANSKFSPEQQAQVLDLCAKYRPFSRWTAAS